MASDDIKIENAQREIESAPKSNKTSFKANLRLMT